MPCPTPARLPPALFIPPPRISIVLAFNNGTYQSVSISAWFAANPSLLLGNFRVPDSTFAAFPKGEVTMPD